MTPRFAVPFAVGLLAAANLVAQSGDKAGERQQPLPSHWIIPPAPVLSPAEQARSFRLPPGFRAELIAAEPLVRDPIAMVFGPDGRLWVVEMPGYMRDIEATGDKDPIGRVVILADTDGDGRMDTRTVFMDGLILGRAVALVDDGVLVAEPPRVWFVRDTDGDDVADAKVEVVGDYGGTGNVEHLPNGLMWAMDNWIYNANYTGRFRYEGEGRFSRESTISRGQWGITQDDTGRLYYNSNSHPLRADLVPAAYFRRNPHLASRAGINVPLVPADLPLWPGRITPGVNRGYRTLRPDGTLPAVTAACSPVIYRGALFPSEFHGNAFLCDPSVNLIKRIMLTESDGDVRGANAYSDTEFMTSTDERFRPVSIYNGPDGALWVVDMYRGIIQERTYVTSYLRRQIEDRGLASPVGLGRIWRIVPENAPPADLKLTLHRSPPLEWVRALGAPQGWTRDTAQRLLVEKGAASRTPATLAALRSFATEAENPLGRLHALWTLDGLRVVDRATLLRALGDRDRRVRAAAVRLAEPFLHPTIDEEILRRLQDLALRAGPELRLQLALSLPEARTPAAEATLRALLRASGDQPYIVDAVISGLAGREESFVQALAAESGESDPAFVRTVRAGTGAVMRSNSPPRINRMLALAGEASAPAWAREAVLAGVEDFLPRMSDGQPLAARLAAEPTPLVALAAGNSADSVLAGKLLERLRWPGKPGMAALPTITLSPAEHAQFEQGRAHFAALCAACHQPEGQGMPGLAPPLVNSRWAVGDERILARIVLVGKAQQNQLMPGLRTTLNDDALAAVLTYVRNAWGHTAGAVEAKMVAEARTATAQRETPYDNADLEALVNDLGPPRPARKARP